jgi:lysophospholipase L1-like esterase
MLTNAPGQFIDAFSATKTAQANTTMASMAAGDGIHVNSLGHDAVFAAVRRWLRNNGYFVP